MSKNTPLCSFLRSQVWAYVLSRIYVYMGLFLRACIYSLVYVHVGSNLHTHAAF